jgi:hypothetical protein
MVGNHFKNNAAQRWKLHLKTNALKNFITLRGSSGGEREGNGGVKMIKST